MYIAKTKLNMSESEFWNSTIYKINKLYSYYIQEKIGSIEDNTPNAILNSEAALNKWGRPVTYSTEF